MSSFSKDIISIIYGPNWNESALILSKLALVGIFLAITSQNITFFKALSFLKIMMINKALALFLLPLFFYFYISYDLLKLLEGIIVFSICLLMISISFLLRVDFKYAMSYLKNMFLAFFISISIIFLHFSLLKISLSNIYLNVSTNGISLLMLMFMIYFCLYLIFVKK